MNMTQKASSALMRAAMFNASRERQDGVTQLTRVLREHIGREDGNRFDEGFAKSENILCMKMLEGTRAGAWMPFDIPCAPWRAELIAESEKRGILDCVHGCIALKMDADKCGVLDYAPIAELNPQFTVVVNENENGHQFVSLEHPSDSGIVCNYVVAIISNKRSYLIDKSLEWTIESVCPGIPVSEFMIDRTFTKLTPGTKISVDKAFHIGFTHVKVTK